MKSIYQIWTFTVLLIAVTACAPVEKKTSAEDQSKNTQEKISSLQTSLDSMSRLEAAVALLHNQTPIIDDSLVQEIKTALDIPQCVITYDKPAATQGNRKSILIISGDSCNFSANYNISYTVKNANLMTIDIAASFLIKDPVLVAKNEVYKTNIRGTGTIKSLDTKILTNISYSGNMWIKDKDALSINFTYVDSKSAVNPDYQANGSSSLVLNYPQEIKTVEGKPVTVAAYSLELRKNKKIVTGKDLSTFTLNSSAIDEAAYVKYMSYLGLLSFGNEL